MGLNSKDWGNIIGGTVSAYNPQAGAAVKSIFGSDSPKAPPAQATLTTPPPATTSVPVYVWVIGGVAAVSLVLILALRR